MVGSWSGTSVAQYLMEMSDTSLHSFDSFSNAALSPTSAPPPTSSFPSALPFIWFLVYRYRKSAISDRLANLIQHAIDCQEFSCGIFLD